MSDPHEPKGLIEWLGFTRVPDYSRARFLGLTIGALMLLVSLSLMFVGAITLVDFIRAGLRMGPYANDLDGTAIRNTGLALAALLGAPFIVWRSIVAAKQVRIADEALFNDKINAAAKDLSARKEVTRIVAQDGHEVVLKEIEDDLVTRAAAIDRVEGLATERRDAAPRVDRLLATYIRGNFAHSGLDETEDPFVRKTPRMDLQRAVDAIGRIHKRAITIDAGHWRLDLKGCDFDGVNFQGGFFRAADFSRSRFEASIFREATLDGTWFMGSLLNFADFSQADLTGAKFDRVILRRSGGLFRSLGSQRTLGLTFIAADISGLQSIGGVNSTSQTFGTKDTKLSPDVRASKLSDDKFSRAHDLRDLNIQENERLSVSDRILVKEMDESGFQNWSPYDSNDFATNHLLLDFYKRIGLNKWPYW